MVATKYDKTIRTGPYQVGLLPTSAYCCNQQLCSLRTLVGVKINDNMKQGDFYCGASSQADFILNYFLSNFLSNFLKFRQISPIFFKFHLKFFISSQPGWQAGTIKVTLIKTTTL